jgi:hypothetical protein
MRLCKVSAKASHLRPGPAEAAGQQ